MPVRRRRRDSAASGGHQGGVRWKTVSCATFGAISGTNWKALAPVPITATRLPFRSTSWRHSGGVEGRAREAVAARDVGQARPVELADGADHRIGLDRLASCRPCPASFARQSDARLVAGRLSTSGLEADVLAQVVLVGARRWKYFSSTGWVREVLRPGVVRLEGVASRCGWGCRPGSPDRCSPARCRPRRRSSR